jgi:hypothetical protein
MICGWLGRIDVTFTNKLFLTNFLQYNIKQTTSI